MTADSDCPTSTGLRARAGKPVMSITMRGGDQPFLDLPPAATERGRHRTVRRRAARYRAVFAIREFRALWWAQVVCYLGDQVAQVAVAILVYTKTSEAEL